MMFKSAPGKEGNQLVPDLAEGPGQASEDGKTWTYKLRQGVKFEDGTEVTSADVKYAVLRSTDKQTFPNGPAYWEAILDLPEGYKGPYKSPNVNTDSAIETPDKYTIVFHTKQPFAAFDYLAQQPNTMPVPKDKDTGAKYRNSIVSSGPYKFADLQPGKSFNLVRNDQWDPATDPNRKALPDRIEVTLNVNADDLDNRLLSGDLDVDVSMIGVQPAAQSRVLQDPNLKENADNPLRPGSSTPRSTRQLPPLDNIECRKAIQYAMDRTAYQTAYGGQFAGGDLATTLLPPNDSGPHRFRPVSERPRSQGRPGRGQEVTGGLRPAERLRDQHRLPRRAAEGEGHCRGVPAGAGSSRHQAHAEAVTRRAITSPSTAASRRTW